MKSGLLVNAGLVLILGACSMSNDGTGVQTRVASLAIPEGVAQIAAPNQDLTTARLLPEDGCYWYLHAGPVETTLLPLRNTEGRPICSASSPSTSV